MHHMRCSRASSRRLKDYSNVELKPSSSSMHQPLSACFGGLWSFPWTKQLYQRLRLLAKTHVISSRSSWFQNSCRSNTEARHQTKQIPFGHLSALLISSAIEFCNLLLKPNETSAQSTKAITNKKARWVPTRLLQLHRSTKTQMKKMKTAKLSQKPYLIWKRRTWAYSSLKIWQSTQAALFEKTKLMMRRIMKRKATFEWPRMLRALERRSALQIWTAQWFQAASRL